MEQKTGKEKRRKRKIKDFRKREIKKEKGLK
jgi:hypothetical protein